MINLKMIRRNKIKWEKIENKNKNETRINVNVTSISRLIKLNKIEALINS